MVYFMHIDEPKVKIEELGFDMEHFGQRYKLNFEIEFCAPGQEDGHGPRISRQHDIAMILLRKLVETQSQLEAEITKRPI